MEQKNKSDKSHQNEMGWYKSLKLSTKFQLNTVIGFGLISFGLALLFLDFSLLNNFEPWYKLFLGIAAVLGGLWFYGAALMYKSQLNSIRISKRYSQSSNKNKGPKKA